EYRVGNASHPRRAGADRGSWGPLVRRRHIGAVSFLRDRLLTNQKRPRGGEEGVGAILVDVVACVFQVDEGAVGKSLGTFDGRAPGEVVALALDDEGGNRVAGDRVADVGVGR